MLKSSRGWIRFVKQRGGGAWLNRQTAHRAEMISGQLVTSEIIMASESGCPIEYHRIDVDKCDPVFDKECQGNKYIPFRRADYDRRTGHSPNSPREQVIPRHELPVKRIISESLERRTIDNQNILNNIPQKRESSHTVISR